MSEVLTKTAVSTSNPKSALKSNDMSAQNSSASKAAGINAGSRVKITGTNYATGQAIPGWVKQNTHTVQQVSGNRALLKEIYSWVYISDLVAEGSSAPKTQAPKSDAKAPESKTNTSESKTPASATKRTPLEKLLVNDPGVKTNQDLINLFYRLGGNTFNGAAAVARTYGVDLNSSPITAKHPSRAQPPRKPPPNRIRAARRRTILQPSAPTASRYSNKAIRNGAMKNSDRALPSAKSVAL